MSHKFGRVKTVTFIHIVYIFNTLPILFLGEILPLQYILILRFLIGLGMGGATSVVPAYISEISPPLVRGRMGTLIQVGVTSGIISAFTIGYLLSILFEFDELKWRWMLGLGGLMSAPTLLLVGTHLVESPRWLVKQGQEEKAKMVLLKISSPALNEQEIEDIIESIRSSFDEAARAHGQASLGMFSRSNLNKLLVAIGIQVFQQLSGFNVLVYYSGTIFTQLGFNKYDALLASAISSFPQIFCLWIVARNLDHYGRKPILLISLTSLMICMGLLGSLQIAVPISFLTSASMKWLNLVIILSARLAFSLGLGPVAAILAAEILPNHIRSLGMAMASSTNWLSNFCVTQGFLVASDVFGAAYVYIFFGFMCMFGAVWVLVFVPETSRRSLEQQDEEREEEIFDSNPSIPKSSSSDQILYDDDDDDVGSSEDSLAALLPSETVNSTRFKRE